MKPDWKKISKSKGYRSLKQCYEHDIQRNWRDKKELRAKFNWVIQRAIHFAHHTKLPVEYFLDTWEENRTNWWLNYYQDGHAEFRKFHSNCLKPRSLQSLIKYYKNQYRRGWIPKETKDRCIRREQQLHAKKNSGKKRWTKSKKEHSYRHHVKRYVLEAFQNAINNGYDLYPYPIDSLVIDLKTYDSTLETVEPHLLKSVLHEIYRSP